MLLFAAENIEKRIFGEGSDFGYVSVAQGTVAMTRGNRHLIKEAKTGLRLNFILLLLIALILICVSALDGILLRGREAEEGGAEIGNSALDEGIVGFEVVEEVVPKAVLVEDLGVPEDDHAVLGPGDGDVEAPGVLEEADAGPLVGPHTGHDDVVLLPALVAVDRCDLYFLVVVGILGGDLAVLLQIVDNVGPLPLVRRDDADLLGLDARPLQVEHDFVHCHRLRTVQVRRP